jgi:hypothetical protein
VGFSGRDAWSNRPSSSLVPALKQNRDLLRVQEKQYYELPFNRLDPFKGSQRLFSEHNTRKKEKIEFKECHGG